MAPANILNPRLNEPITAIAKNVGTAKLNAVVGTIPHILIKFATKKCP